MPSILGRLRGLPKAVNGDEPIRKQDGGSGGGGGGGASGERETITINLLGSVTPQTGTVSLGKTTQLLKVESTGRMRMRLYGNASARTADISRPIGTAPAADAGLQFECLTTASLLSFTCAPAPLIIDDSGTPSGAIPYTIEPDVTQTAAFTVKFTFIEIEA